MSAIREIEWESCLIPPLADAESERRFREQTGRPAGTLRFFVGSEWCVDAVTTLSKLLLTQTWLDPTMADYVGLVVSQDNSCRYCFGTVRAFMRIMGLPESRIRQIELDLHTAELSERERVGLEFTRKLSRSNPLVNPADQRRLRDAGYDDDEIVELCALVAMNIFFNRISTLVALPPRTIEELPDRWYARVFRPVIKLQLRKINRQGRPAPLEPGQAAGPFEHVVSALDGLQLAHELRRLIDGAFASSQLSPRSVGLTFAVVARALGCARSEREATRLVEQTGLSPASIEQALTHLSCSDLDPVEQAIVPFARDTVWYQPAHIQKQGRLLLDELGRERFLEFVTAASLANAVCRLGVLAGDCR